MPTLILTPRYTEDAQALWRAAGRLGWDVQRLASWRVPEEVRTVPDPVLYLEALFGPTLADQFGLRLLEPPIDWLPRLPDEYRKRWVYLTTLGQARALSESAFIQPPNDKSFPARVYSGLELPSEYDNDSPVPLAGAVVWQKGVRVVLPERRLRPRTGR